MEITINENPFSSTHHHIASLKKKTLREYYTDTIHPSRVFLFHVVYTFTESLLYVLCTCKTEAYFRRSAVYEPNETDVVHMLAHTP